MLQTLENRNSRVDAILLCETFLNSNTLKLVNIPNYTLVSNHCQNRKGGGTGILLRNGIIYKPRKDPDQFKDKVIETTFIEINSRDGRKIIVGSLYKPPNSSSTEFLAKLNEITSKIST